MRYEKNRKIAGIDEYKIQKMAKILIIPVIVIILVIVILIADRKPKEKEASSGAASVKVSSQSADGNIRITDAAEKKETAEKGEKAEQGEAAESSIEPDTNEYVSNFDEHGLQVNAVTEVNELVAKYEYAKVNGDAEMMYEVFGRTDTDGLDEMRERMGIESRAYEGYENTTCYTTAGAEEDSYIVYISANIRFAGIETPAPTLMWAYVYKGADGNFCMKEPDKLSEQQKEKLNTIAASEDVTLLDKEMKTKLAQAVINDRQLAALYQIWSDSAEASEPRTVEDGLEMVIHSLEAEEGTPDGENAETEGTSAAPSDKLEDSEVKIGVN